MLESIARKRVFVGTLYLLVVVVTAAPAAPLWWAGLAIATLGEAVRTWASGYLFKNESLATTGPFSVVRNPLYLGSFFLGFGITLMGGRLLLIALYPVIFLPIYVKRIEQEEAVLVEHFGDEATAYFERIPRLVPQLSTFQPAGILWDLRRVVYIHREWGNWLLLTMVAAWTWFRMGPGL